MKKQERSIGVSEAELIKIAVKTLGLDELSPFDPQKKIIEYQLEGSSSSPLVNSTLQEFADETASESPAPGGGSVSAYVGSLGISLSTMVANLSSHKRGWDDKWEIFSKWAEEGQDIKSKLLRLVDEDTNAFTEIMMAFRLPKSSDAEKATRSSAIQAATRNAIDVPFQIMKLSLSSFNSIKAMAEMGNPNSITDVAVGALCARAAVQRDHARRRTQAVPHAVHLGRAPGVESRQGRFPHRLPALPRGRDDLPRRRHRRRLAAQAFMALAADSQ